jgi:hypothetical protein
MKQHYASQRRVIAGEGFLPGNEPCRRALAGALTTFQRKIQLWERRTGGWRGSRNCKSPAGKTCRVEDVDLRELRCASIFSGTAPCRCG